MSWSVQAVILGCEMVLGYVLGRVFIPYFRRIKTGKFDFYIGDRFAKDGSEPKFGGVVIMLCVIFGIVTGVIFYDSQAVLSFENGEFSRRVFIALGGVLMLTAIGLSEDYVKEKKLGIGMKPFYKICMEYLICLGVCVGLRYCGGVQTAVLMPFHLGYVQFGRLFYPLFPLFMTVGINMVKIHDCAGGKTDTGTDGLCAVTALIFSAGLSSGLAAGAAVVVDGACGLLQYIVFKIRKKLLMKGYTLHEHLQKKGHGDHAVIGIFAVISVAGAAAAIAFLVYSGKFFI